MIKEKGKEICQRVLDTNLTDLTFAIIKSLKLNDLGLDIIGRIIILYG